MIKQQEFRKQTEEAKFEAFSLMCKKVTDLEKENRLLGHRCNQLLKDKGELTDKIADIKANCDLAIEGRDIKIMELEQLIEKMRNCVNCRYKHCDTSSVSIDKDGNETFHSWNEEKERYCDTGKNGKYQCWEIKE